MDLSFLNSITDKLSEIGKFIFESYAGVGILIGLCLLITLTIAVILEIKTRKKFIDRGEKVKNDDEETA